jgi:Flp pilus assembly CpaE family ATPase
VDGALLDSLLARPRAACRCSPASERIETLELVDGNAATAIIKALRAHFTYTVVDCEHHPTDRTLTAFDGADRIVVVTQLNVAAIRQRAAHARALPPARIRGRQDRGRGQPRASRRT